MAISSPGVGSNLDVNSIVTQLMALEQRPLTQLTRKEAAYQAQLSAYGSLKGAISSFQAALAGMRSLDRFDGFRAQTGNPAVFTASAANSAAAGNYSIEVTTLAEAQVVQTSGVASTTAASSTGTLTLQVGSGPVHTVILDSSNNTLAGLRDAINQAQSDVQAVIINDGSETPYRLVLTAAKGGTANTIQINQTLTDGAIRDAITGITQTRPPANASISINGVAITSTGNTITDAIPGVTLQLTGTGSSTLSIARDTAAVQSSVQAFVKAYNDLSATLAALTDYNPATKKGGPLTGNSSVLAIQSQLRATLGSALPGLNGSLTRLSQIGVEFDKNGQLTLNTTRLNAAIAANPQDIGGLFALQARSSSSLVAYVRSSSGASTGAYEVHIDSAATRAGAAATSAPAVSTIIDGSNDTLSFTLDGVASGNLTLAHGTYTASQLATALQNAINSSAALSAGGAKATVTLENGKLNVTSNRYGSQSSVSGFSGTALGALGYAGDESGTGNDVAGHYVLAGETIAATGSGQDLAAADHSAARGLTVRYSGDSSQLQAGAEATLNLSEGYAVLLDRLASQFLGSDGSLASRSNGINRSIEDIARQRERINLRLANTEARLRAQFMALDTLISRLNSTSNYLQQQLANLPGASRNR
jgi:flagellar hook-associated protein 2